MSWPFVEVDGRLNPEDLQGVKQFYDGSEIQPRDFDNRVPYYIEIIFQAISSLQPKSVFEFGCNAGRNLNSLRKLLPSTQMFGTDVNRAAIEHGRKEYGIPIEVADEKGLEKMKSDSFDVVFTVSVLDHLALPQETVYHLTRISREFVIIYEIVHEKEGKVIKMTSENNELIPGYPFSYFHNYDLLFRKSGAWKVIEAVVPAFKGTLGVYYRLFLFTKKDKYVGSEVLGSLVLSSLDVLNQKQS